MENQIERLQRDILETQASLKLIQEQIAKKKPWYQEISGLISVAAFLLSIGSTFYSCQRESAQDRSAARMTMNSLSQRLTSLPKENLEAAIKYKDDPQALNWFLSLSNIENMSNIDSLDNWLRRYPDLATDQDRYVLAMALGSSGQPIRANRIFSELAQSSKNINVLIAAIRNLAAVDFFNKKIDAGRQRYRQGIDIVNRSTELDANAKNFYNQTTYTGWANMEYTSGDCSAAKEALERAKALLVAGNPNGKSLVMMDQAIQACLLIKQPIPFQLPPLSLPQDGKVLLPIPR